MKNDCDPPPLSLNFAALAREHGERPALICQGTSLSYRQVGALVLQHREELNRGTGPCALLATTRRDALVVFHACLTFGRPVLLVPQAAPEALRALLFETTGATQFYSEDGFSHTFTNSSVLPPNKADDVLIPTSGTTGQPKIVCLSQAALIASARATTALVGLNEQSKWALTLPYAHVGGLAILIRCALKGAAVVAKEYDLRSKEGVHELGRDSISHLSLVPTQLQRALESGARCPESIRAVLVGGASCPPGLRARARHAGWPVAFTYGFTEAASQVCTQQLGHKLGRAREDSATMERDVGRPIEGTQVALDGSGRISVRGPTLMNRYWGSPRRDPEEWFVTQDYGHWDEADCLVIRGRADNMIISGGENVAAERIEDSLLTLSSVREAAVFGVDDVAWGQKIVALLVGEPSPIDVIRAALKDHLESYALPKEVHFCAALPRLQNGKLDREAAKALLQELRGDAPIDACGDGGKVSA